MAKYGKSAIETRQGGDASQERKGSLKSRPYGYPRLLLVVLAIGSGAFANLPAYLGYLL